NLGICETPKKAAELKALITQLHAKSPEMLAGILDNCQWINGKGQDTFIYSIAVASMQMELAGIFDQEGFDALPNGANPLQSVMLGTRGGNGKDGYSVFDTETAGVLKNTWNKFAQWLGANKNSLHNSKDRQHVLEYIVN
ncbi:MAG: hypothetical protein LBQ23_04395, partial [Puniceicoccales bacterium]|nr:hypothetical protein [Puniceicoccales bacterium]